ncbi:hypothetical protein THAOC_26602, partial [Thalassiosira oceanica]
MGRAAAEESLRVFHSPSSSTPLTHNSTGDLTEPSTSRIGRAIVVGGTSVRRVASEATLIQIRGAEREDERGQRPRAHPPPPEDVGDPPAAVVRPLRRGRAGRARGRRGGRRAGRQAPLRRGDVRLGGGRPAGEGASQ